MRLQTAVEIHCYGTSEGVTKAWNTRGRGKNQQYALNDRKQYLQNAQLHDKEASKQEKKGNSDSAGLHRTAAQQARAAAALVDANGNKQSTWNKVSRASDRASFKAWKSSKTGQALKDYTYKPPASGVYDE